MTLTSMTLTHNTKFIGEIILMFVQKTLSYLSGIAALDLELVDLGLSNVSTLLSLLQLMLNLPALGQVSIGLFLLLYMKLSAIKTEKRNKSQCKVANIFLYSKGRKILTASSACLL